MVAFFFSPLSESKSTVVPLTRGSGSTGMIAGIIISDNMTSYGMARLTADPKSNFVDDMTTTAALTLMVGIIAFVFGTVNLIGVAAEDEDWDGAEDAFPPILLLLANIVQTLFGLVSVFIGFQYVACRWGSTWSSLFGLGITLAAWFPFLVQIALFAFNADNEIIDVPPLMIPFDVTRQEIGGIAVMAALGFYGYAGTVIGALTFLHWKMYRCFAGYADTYDASYYRSRLTYYGGLIIMTGAVQLALGLYVQDKFGDGQLASRVVVGPFFILWPELSVTVGACQLIVGLLTLYRSTTPGVGPASGNRDSMLFSYQFISWFVFLVTIGCQVIGQISLNDTNGPAIFLVNIIGFCLFPIYLDVMAHTTPENVTKDMFSMKTLTNSSV